MATLKKILMVDDDADLREALADQLVLTEEFDVFEAGTGADGLVRAKEEHYDLVILDVGLPDMDGRELCRLMRKQGVKCPIVMLTGHTTDSDTILGLDRARTIMSRSRSSCRCCSPASGRSCASTSSPRTRSSRSAPTPSSRHEAAARRAGAKIRLTEKETNILKYLYRASDAVVPRDELLHEVWGYNAGVTTHTLETHIYRLRQKIEPDPSNARILVTETGGYRLVS
jgi:DNA-binding response OmpR family regulator